MDTAYDYLYYIWLTQINGIGPAIARNLLKILKSPEIIYNSKLEDLLSVAGVGIETAQKIIGNRDLSKAKSILKVCSDKHIKISIIDDNIFPDILKEYKDIPILLYYNGILHKKLSGIAIVGSRRCTVYGKQVTVEAAEFLAQNNIPVISGMAKGIDSYSHTACLKAGGFTAAIFGCGVDVCYPKEHFELMKKIIENGVVISEYAPNTQPKPEYFPRRNRIISALASKVLIAEAGEKSGALITAEYALKQKKELYVAAGNIYCKEFKGSNKLINTGAKIYLNPKQLLDGMLANVSVKRLNKQINPMNNALEEDIMIILKYNKLTIDEIASKMKKDKDKIIDILFSMEINNKIKVVGGKYVNNDI